MPRALGRLILLNSSFFRQEGKPDPACKGHRDLPPLGAPLQPPFVQSRWAGPEH